MWKQFIKDYLGFSRKDKIGAIVLLGFIILFSFLPRVLSFFSEPSVELPDSTIQAAVRELEEKSVPSSRKYENTHYKTKQYIRKNYRQSATYSKSYSREKFSYPGFEKKIDTRDFSVDINTADTASFIALPGIGSKLASRIILFRERLGGFHSIDQVAETYGIHDSVFQKIKPFLKNETFELRQININTATLQELKAHPYIRWNLANPIIAYRDEHGMFGSVEDLKNILAISPEAYQKIMRYLTVD